MLTRLLVSSALFLPYGQGSELGDAVRRCEVPRVEQLIASGLSVNEGDNAGETPLHQATRSGQPKCVYLLLEAGANPHLVNRRGERAHLLARRYPEGIVHDQMFELLDNLRIVTPETHSKVRSLQYAALRGNVEIATLVLELGADPNASQPDGSTPLHNAALKGHSSIVHLLLEHGANPKLFDGDGYAPLHLAVLGGDVRTVQELIKAGADLSAVTKNSLMSALHLAASWDRLDVIRLLLTAGADRLAKDGKGHTASDLAAANNHREAAALLASPQAFDVASVKISEQFRQGSGTRLPAEVQVVPGSVTMRNVGLTQLITWAYKVSPYQIVNAPGRDSARYDILAKIDRPATTDEMRLMMQALLTERFRLALHREAKRVSAFALVEAKGGHRLKQVETADGPGISPVPGTMALRGRSATLEQLAIFLSDPLRTPVKDMTGLKGKYDFTFDITEFIPRDPAPGDPPPDPVAIFQAALPKQLGLKLDARVLTVEMLIIDHIETVPVEN